MPGEALSVGPGALLRTLGVEAMTLCAGCNYPIPSWQHNGACKPVAEKVPPGARDPFPPRLRDPRWTGKTQQTTATATEDVPEIPTDVPKKRGRPGKWSSETERKAAYRARKQG